MTSVSANLFYLKPCEVWSREKPYFITIPPSALPQGQKATNEESQPVGNIQIRDIRGLCLSHRDLDIRGFTFAKQDFSLFSKSVFVDYKSLRAGYVPAMENWLKDLLGAESVSTLSVNIRRRDKKFPEFTWGTSGDTQPIQGVHVGTAS